MIAALYVDPRGPYADRDDVDPWDEERDARLYDGPHPVVAHPPCARWGRYWSGGPNPQAKRRLKGDDGGCFEAALASVRRWGGVLEHPEASHAWARFGIPKPPRKGGWIEAEGGWTCCVEQGHYGHRSRKMTWLYYAGPDKPFDLIWGKSPSGERLDEGYHSKEERAAAVAAGAKPRKRLSAKQNILTPEPFAALMISLAGI